MVATSVKIDVIAFMLEKTTPSDAVTEAWIGIMRAQQKLLLAIEADLKQAGMPPLGWYDVLWELVRAPDSRLRPFEIEERTLLAQYNLSRLIDRLEREGLVGRETFAEDGRGRWVVVTDAGRALRERMWVVYSMAIERHVGSKLDDTSAKALAGLLKNLSA
jgi:DNA-binding MarR family transcriptional regulator